MRRWPRVEGEYEPFVRLHETGIPTDVFVELLLLPALWVWMVGPVLHPKQSAVGSEELWSWLELNGRRVSV